MVCSVSQMWQRGVNAASSRCSGRMACTATQILNSLIRQSDIVMISSSPARVGALKKWQMQPIGPVAGSFKRRAVRAILCTWTSLLLPSTTSSFFKVVHPLGERARFTAFACCSAVESCPPENGRPSHEHALYLYRQELKSAGAFSGHRYSAYQYWG